MAVDYLYADLDAQGVNRIQNLPIPVNPAEPVRLQDLNAAVEGLAWKDNARVATQGNLNLASPGASIDGVTLAVGDRVLVKVQTAASENGVYVWNGAAVAMSRSLDANTADELESATVPVDEGTSTGTAWRQTAVNFTLGTSAVSWVQFGAASPPATTTAAGIIEIATQAEADAGTANNLAITPALLAGLANRKLKKTQTIGDGATTQFDVTHNFGTRDVQVQVIRNASPWDTAHANVVRPDTNTVRVTMTPAIPANGFQVVILG